MGYTTYFDGAFTVTPPLNEHEISYLNEFASTRRMERERQFYVGDDKSDVINHNDSGSQPGLWCQWVPTIDGESIVWDEGEKFYYPNGWLDYIIRHFLTPQSPEALSLKLAQDERFAHFTFDHSVTGVVKAQGEDSDDVWALVAVNNVTESVLPEITWNLPSELADIAPDNGWDHGFFDRSER